MAKKFDKTIKTKGLGAYGSGYNPFRHLSNKTKQKLNDTYIKAIIEYTK